VSNGENEESFEQLDPLETISSEPFFNEIVYPRNATLPPSWQWLEGSGSGSGSESLKCVRLLEAGDEISILKMIAIVGDGIKEISKHFESEVAFLGDSFSDVITRISELTLPELCCDEHRDNLMVTLIYNYVVMRFRFEAKHKRETELREGKTLRHKNRKLGKLANRKGKK
jgi:hypothetical protein